MAIKEFFQDYKKMIKIFGIISLILFVISLLIGFLTSLFESIIFSLVIILALIGYVGGVWLWSFLAKSEKIMEMKNIIKIVGIIGIIALFGTVGFSIYMFFQPESVLRGSIFNLNFLLLFVVFYLLGYDYAIMRSENKNHGLKIETSDNIIKKTEENEEKNNNDGLFTLDWKIIKNVGSAILVVVLLFFFPLLLTGLYGNLVGETGASLTNMMELFVIFLICILGFGIAYMVWEHLKKSDLIKGGFKTQLIILSLATTIVAILLLGYGIYTIDYGVPLLDTVGSYTDLRNIVISITLFMECMGFYFVGLFISIILAKDKK
ncbi:MAG: hypothetical protein EU551_03960 [Promethearchaeota archaeon]|nr:MAG: hypothetical protein EU551_03960 [Candidatus Lokiarchaeota archaeon]